MRVYNINRETFDLISKRVVEGMKFRLEVTELMDNGTYDVAVDSLAVGVLEKARTTPETSDSDVFIQTWKRLGLA